MNVQPCDWMVLIATTVVAVVALVLISVAGEVYGLGLVLFVVAVGFAFHWLKRMFDRADADRH